jgi:4-diphosphocytidyl-2C-methyl-D-erythritol kinase
MSGSGPTVIGLTRSEEDGRDIASQLSRCDVQIHVACTTPAASRVTETGVT